MTSACKHGFPTDQCASCHACPHGLMASGCGRCLTAAAAASRRRVVAAPTEGTASHDHQGYEIFYVPEVSGWHFRGPDSAASLRVLPFRLPRPQGNRQPACAQLTALTPVAGARRAPQVGTSLADALAPAEHTVVTVDLPIPRGQVSLPVYARSETRWKGALPTGFEQRPEQGGAPTSTARRSTRSS